MKSFLLLASKKVYRCSMYLRKFINELSTCISNVYGKGMQIKLSLGRTVFTLLTENGVHLFYGISSVGLNYIRETSLSLKPLNPIREFARQILEKLKIVKEIRNTGYGFIF